MRSALTGFCVLLLAASTAQAGTLEPDFSKSFFPSSIGPGSHSRLEFRIDNSDSPASASGLSFSDVLPAGLVISPASRVSNGCGGTLVAPAGGSTIDFSDGLIGANQICTLAVDVVAASPGSYDNVSGPLSSSAGPSPAAAATLTVNPALPGFSKAFSPASIGLDGTSRLVFTIDNSANGSAVTQVSFSDTLPAGLVVADPAQASTTCSNQFAPAFAPVPGSGAISGSAFSISPAVVAAGASCEFAVDVKSSGFGRFLNSSGELSVSGAVNGSAGFANAALEVPTSTLYLSKAFETDPIAAGESVVLTYRVFNFDRNSEITAIGFDDDLGAVIAGLATTGVLPAEPCGPGSSLGGGSVLSLSGGRLPVEGSCEFSVTVAVPPSAVGGSYSSESSPVSGILDGAPIVGPRALDSLRVAPVPRLQILAPASPVAVGGVFQLDFTLENTSQTEAASGVTFVIDQLALLPGFNGSQNTPLPVDPCGAGSTLSNAPNSPAVGNFGLVLAGGSLAAGGSCTFSVSYSVPATVNAGQYSATSSRVSATVGAEVLSGPPQSVMLSYVQAPRLSHQFDPARAAAGDTVSLIYTLEVPEGVSQPTENIGFSHDLSSIAGGLVPGALPTSPCGAGSSLQFSAGALTLSAGQIGPAGSCMFSVDVQIPSGAAAGTYPSTTSAVSADIGGTAVLSSSSASSLGVASLFLDAEVIDDPVFPGAVATLRYRLENVGGSALSAIAFSHDLAGGLPGLAAAGLPSADICGAGSALSGTSTVAFSGGTLAPGASCQFDVVITVPGAAVPGQYGLPTSQLSAQDGGSPITQPGVNPELVVAQLGFAKQFIDDPVLPGATVTLRYEITNPAASGPSAQPIAFNDDLGAALPGLVATGLPLNDVCGAGSVLSGSSTLALSGGTLDPASSCAFEVVLQVPSGIAGAFPSSSSPLTVGGIPNAPAASDTLSVLPLQVELQFQSPAAPGSVAPLLVRVRNLAPIEAFSVALSIDLAAAIAGSQAEGAPQTNVCGPGSTLTGTSVVSLSGASLGASATCEFTVQVRVPAGLSQGLYPVSSDPPTQQGSLAGSAGSADLLVVLAGFSKDFTPAAVSIGAPSRMRFVLQNTSSVAISGLAFVDAFPAGLVVANPANLSADCGGSVTAGPGATELSLSGGSLNAASQCTIAVDVLANAPGALVNTTGALQTAIGAMGSASATLTVSAGPGFSATFVPDAILSGASSRLRYTVDNSTGAGSVGGLAFETVLPAGLRVAVAPAAASTCAGAWSPAAASTTLTFSGGSVGAASTCTVEVDITGDAAGSYPTTSSPLSTAGLQSPAASASLRIEGPPGFSKRFEPAAIAIDQSSRLVLSIDNSASTLAVSALAFTDTLPAGLSLAATPNASTSCTGGSLTAVAGSAVLAYTGGSVPAGGLCTVEADVVAAASGTYTNTSGPLSSAAGDSGTATAQLQVADAVLQIEKSFDPELAFAGDWVLVRYRLVNPSLTATVTDISFTDDVGVDVPGAETLPLPGPDVCGAGSGVAGLTTVSLVNGLLGPGAECVFGLQFRLPPNIAPGSYESITSAVSGRVGTGSAVGAPASATLTVAALPSLVKTMPATARQGELIELVFTLTHPAGSPAVSGLSFSDDLEAFLPGARAEGLPLSDVCGPGSSISGSSLLSFQAGSLGSGQSCSFSVPVRLPVTALPGNYTNVTSPLQGSFGAVPANGGPASAASRGLSLGSVLPAPTVVPTADLRAYMLLALLLASLGALALRRRG